MSTPPNHVASTTGAALAVEHLVVQFPAVRALDDVSLDFASGQVHGLVGENGAGKSTLMRVLAGLQTPTSGTVRVDGAPVRFTGPRDAMTHGIGMIHQELNLVDSLDVAANVFLGREVVRGGRLDRATMVAETRALLKRVGATFRPETLLGELPLAGQQLVEIAKALGLHARTLIFDEPTAVLSERETEVLFQLIRDLRTEGVTVLYISHRLIEIPLLCDTVSVLRDGRLVARESGPSATPESMARQMVGRDLGDLYPERQTPVPSTEVALTVSDVRVDRTRPAVSFDVAPGEIVGLAGLVGAGRTELAESLAGLRPRTGIVRRGAREVPASNPRAARDAGIAYLSEDRKGAGLHVELDTVENTVMANLNAYVKGGRLDRGRMQAASASWVEQLGTRVGDVRTPVRLLSGGNQQKVSLAKQLDGRPAVIVLDEPTRGVDVGAKREIYLLIQRLAHQGLGCVVISSELPELRGLCHRILVMREGELVANLPVEDATEEAVMAWAAGVTAPAGSAAGGAAS